MQHVVIYFTLQMGSTRIHPDCLQTSLEFSWSQIFLCFHLYFLREIGLSKWINKMLLKEKRAFISYQGQNLIDSYYMRSRTPVEKWKLLYLTTNTAVKVCMHGNNFSSLTTVDKGKQLHQTTNAAVKVCMHGNNFRSLNCYWGSKEKNWITNP